MQATRRARLQSVLQERLSSLISREVRDPRVGNVTITRVDVVDDGSLATIYVTLLGYGHRPTEFESDSAEEAFNQAQEKKMQDCITGLNSAASFLKRFIAKELDIKQIPTLTFKEDKGLENSNRVYEILKQLDQKK